MKMIVIFTISILSCPQCKTSDSHTVNEERCKQMGEKLSYQQLNYVVEKDTTFIRLDSALRIIDTMMCDCRKYYAGLVSTKLQILSVKQEYIQALNFIRDLDEKEIYPLNKLILSPGSKKNPTAMFTASTAVLWC